MKMNIKKFIHEQKLNGGLQLIRKILKKPENLSQLKNFIKNYIRNILTIERMNKNSTASVYTMETQNSQNFSPTDGIQTLQNHFIKICEAYKVKKKLQKIFLFSLNFIPSHLKKVILQKQITAIQQKNSIFNKIRSKSKLREKVIDELILWYEYLKNERTRDVEEISQQIQKYQIVTLQYAETLLRMCEQFSHHDESTYEKLLLKCGTFFMELQWNSLRDRFFPDFFQFEQGFDPFLLNLKSKDSKKYIELQRAMFRDLKTSNRLMFAHKQMLKGIKSYQLTKQSHNTISYQSSETIIKKKLRDYTIKIKQNKNHNSLQSRSMQILQVPSQQKQQIRKMVQFKIRRKKSLQKGESPTEDNIKITQNFRMKSFRQNLVKSLDLQTLQHQNRDRSVISTGKVRNKSQNSTPTHQNVQKMPRKLNFKAVDLQPLQSRNQRSSLSFLNNDQNVQKLQSKKNNISSFRYRTKNYRKFSLLDKRKDQSSQNQNSQLNLKDFCPDDDKMPKKLAFSQKKLNFILLNRKFKFQTEQDLGSEVSDQVSSKCLDSWDSERKIEKDRKLNTFSERMDRRKEIQDRKRKISEVDEDKQLSRNVTPKTNEVQNQLFQIKKLQKESKKIENSHNQNQRENQTQYCRASSITPFSFEHIQSMRFNQTPIQEEINQQASQQDKRQQQNSKQVQKNKKQIEKKLQNSNRDQFPPKNKQKIILKAVKFNLIQIPFYIQKLGIKDDSNLFNEISNHQHYIFQFYLNETLFNIFIFAPSLDFVSIEVKKIRQIYQDSNSIQLDQIARQKLRKNIIKNFIQIIQKSSSTFKSISILFPTDNQKWMVDCGFKEKDYKLVYFLNNINENKKKPIKQFLSLECQILSISQQINESFLYSDEISPFRSGKYDIDQRIFSEQQLDYFSSEIFNGLSDLSEVNKILSQKQLETFETEQQIEELISKQSSEQNKMKLRLFQFQQIFQKNFIIFNGWMKTTSRLVFCDKNQKISQISLANNYFIYFGKGFQHIGTMKNKLTHYKTRIKSQRTQEQPIQIATKIRFFSKQLYGLIKFENGTAFYGNWEINFLFKHQFIGKVNYTIDTSSSQNRVVFGNSSFFVTIYQGDRFLIGWEVQQNDFLY